MTRGVEEWKGDKGRNALKGRGREISEGQRLEVNERKKMKWVERWLMRRGRKREI